MAYSEGNPHILFFGLDYRGRVCGEKSLSGFDARYWVNAGQVVTSVMSNPANFFDSKSVCLKQCPRVNEKTTSNYTVLPWVCNYPDGYGPSDQFPDPHQTGAASPVPMTYTEWARRKYNYFDLLTPEQKTSSLNLQGPCFPVLMKTTNQYDVCQPYGGIIGRSDNSRLYKVWTDMGGKSVDDPGSIVENSVFSYIGDGVRVMNRYMNDLTNGWLVVLVCGVGVTLVLSYFWLFLLKLFAPLMAWLVIIVANLMSIALTALLYLKAGIISADSIDAFVGTDYGDDLPEDFDSSSKNKDTLLICAIVTTVFTVCLMAFTFFMISRVKLALRCLEVGRKALSKAPQVMIYPATFPFLFGVGFIALWLFAIVHIFSMGNITQRECTIDQNEALFIGLGGNPNCGAREQCQCGYDVEVNNQMKYMGLYFLFALLWVLAFNNGFTKLVVAGAVAPYYWNRGEMQDSPLSGSFKNAFKYHQGSVACGAFLVSIVQFVAILLKFLEKRMKAMSTNSAVRYIWYCINCCIHCLKRLIAFITGQAYVMIAIEGKGFFKSAMRAGGLIAANALKSAAVQIVGDSILALAKLSVVIGSGVACIAILENKEYYHGSLKVTSPLTPCIASMIISYLLSSKFFAVIETSIDTMFLSFCLDCEKNGKPLLAPPVLHAMMDSDEEE
ncbi:choline transporter-like protein [Chloropicon primus]|uniref:Choline transporter-like protein n=1 Tax=Chloropicon primus TaxID=1764295 RepID=A0A5B8MUD1_9CHLO|nr:choline transporter-like protein [Chloropicon primus]|eukprot:QDZ23052.1 choline transporter-like protein [Chloropicon primus]